jgi:hypothetical protein
VSFWPAAQAAAIVIGEPVALLAIVTLAPVTVPAVVGANVTVNVTDCPGVSEAAPQRDFGNTFVPTHRQVNVAALRIFGTVPKPRATRRRLRDS